MGQYEDAIRSYDEALKIDPTRADVWYNRGIDSNNLKRYADSVFSFKKSIDLDSSLPDAWYNIGIALNNLGRYEDALYPFRKCIEIDQSYGGRALNNMGFSLINLGRYDDAVELLEKSIEIDPSNYLPYRNMASALTKQGKHREAMTYRAKYEMLRDIARHVVPHE